LKNKGHLGNGADADIAIHKFEVPFNKLASNPNAIEKGFAEAKYTIKDGKIVYYDGNIQETIFGKTIRVKANVPKDLRESIQEAIEERFRKHYTVSLRNYAVQKEYFPKEEVITTKMK
jgi:formylmethanofuran dehydrogenase subunit A